MNRQFRRKAARLKPHGNRHDVVRIPKILLQDRDFHQIDLLILKLRKNEVETVDGHIVMTAPDGEVYRVVPALEGWIEYWRGLADKTGFEYDDTSLVKLKNKLQYGMPLLLGDIVDAELIVEAQRAMFYRTPASLISSQATTQQIKMLMEDRT